MWQVGLTGPALVGAAAWVAVWTLGLLRQALLIAQTYRVLTPLLRWWPAPRRVPASQLRERYR